MLLLVPTKSAYGRSATSRVRSCYSVFDRFFPECGLLDYTEGMYYGDPATPYDVAQANQLRYVLDQAGCTRGARILEIGCGNGTLLDAMKLRGAEGIGITISPEQVARCRRRGLDARLMNYVDLDDAKFGGADANETWQGRFDAVIANGSMEHFVQAADAAAGRDDEIYRRFFEVGRRMIDPRSSIRRLVTTTIHFVRPPAPESLLRSPLAFRFGSDEFHWAMLARSFGGWYPVEGQLERCAQGLFRSIARTDGTHDYHLTSEHWLGRMKAILPTAAGGRLLLGALPFAARHPLQLGTMFVCMLGSQSWNWQFRGSQPPTRLLRYTWACE